MDHHQKKHEKKDNTPAGGPLPAAKDASGSAEVHPKPPVGAESPAAGETAESLAKQLEKTRAERDDYLARLQRVSADFLNFQKRAQKEISSAHEFGNTDLIKSFLPVLDDMERAMAAARAAGAKEDQDPLLKGVQLVHDKALAILQQNGLTIIEAAGKPFDPSQHQAIMHLPSGQHPPETVMQELQKGYMLKGRTIRPSSVVVSKAPEAEEKTQEQKDPSSQE